jgi:peptide/nickel transport system substrate-binding protein
MKPIVWLCAALLELAVQCGVTAAALRPQYGGELRVYLRARAADADPATWPRGGWEREAKICILKQVFEPLVSLDERGMPAPALADEWRHDANFRRWSFSLRPGVVFHDGTALTPALAAAALSRLGEGFTATPFDTGVAIQCRQPAPELPARLALPRNWISKRSTDGTATGTGPFRLVEWEPSRRAVLQANERHWAGRPFLDAVRFEMGRSAREQLVALELGRADIVELGPSDFRRAVDRGAATWTSRLNEVIALEAPEDRLREALTLAIDRGPIHNVLLGRRGEPSGALLPQWLSGYAFLFEARRDPVKARKAASALAGRVVRIAFDAADSVARNIAERIAVDLRQVGITAEASASGKADARVVRLRIVSANPVTALRELGARIEAVSGPPYEAERAFLESSQLLPLFHVPDLFALSPRVRKFSWRLADVWVEPVRP